MALSDWFEIKDKQTYGLIGQILNVWHVERTNPAYTSANIAQTYLDWVLPSLLPLQHPNVVHTTLVVQNLGTPTDFTEVTVGLAGTNAGGEGIPSFAALRIQFLRERTDMKHGWKRFVGLTETNTSGNNLTGTLPATLQTYADKLVAPWELAVAPGTAVCSFGVIARICAEVDAAGACLSYRLPENDAELKFYIPGEAVGRTTVGSQTTRK